MNSSRQLKAVREVLRHIDHPDRLRDNALVGWRFQGDSSSANAAVRVRQAIEAALVELPERQRDIIGSCDLKGESHAHAIARLAISERHFYRERHAAAERLCAALSTDSTPVACDVSQADSAVTLPLCFADAAQQIGDVASGLRLLLDVQSGSLTVRDRLALACRLAEYCAESGDLTSAAAHVETARRLSSQSLSADGVSSAVASAAQAVVAWIAGDVRNAVRAATHAGRVLRNELTYESPRYESEALAVALLVESEAAAISGQWTVARRGAMEAGDILRASNSLRAVLLARTQLTAADAYMLDPARIDSAATEYRRIYRDAVTRGLSLEATVAGCRLALFHRFVAAPQRAAEALERILPIARHVLTLEDRAQICLDLASAYAEVGRLAMARDLIAEARAHALPGGFAIGLCDLLSSELCLQNREYDAALRLSQAAKDALEPLDRRGALGSVRRVQAIAQHALGNGPLARGLIAEAILDTECAGHPYVIAKVHLAAARITGKSVHRRHAKELFAALHRLVPNR